MGVTWTYEEAVQPDVLKFFKYHQIFWLHVPYWDLLRAKTQNVQFYERSSIDYSIDLYDSEFVLGRQLVEWLEANRVKSKFTGVNLQYRLEIDTHENAMKFKLRWC